MELQKAEKKAKELIQKHKPDYSFVWDNAKVRFGCCNYRKKQISLSRELVQLNTENDVVDVILHEIAHAIVGAGNGHNNIWRNKAIEIGCDGCRCYGNEVKTPKGKYQYQCPNCNRVINRYRRIKRPLSCGECCNKYNSGRFTEKYAFKRKYEVKKNE